MDWNKLAELALNNIPAVFVAVFLYFRVRAQGKNERLATRDKIAVKEHEAEIEEKARKDKQLSDLIGLTSGLIAGLNSLTAEIRVGNELDQNRAEIQRQIADQHAAELKNTASNLSRHTEAVNGLTQGVHAMGEQLTNETTQIKQGQSRAVENLSQRIELSEGNIRARFDEKIDPVASTLIGVDAAIKEIKTSLLGIIRDVDLIDKKLDRLINPLPPVDPRLDALPPEIIDNARKTPPPGTLKAITPDSTIEAGLPPGGV